MEPRAGRLAMLRRMLIRAVSPAECVPIVAEMLTIAAGMARRADDGAARARPVIGQALGYLRAASWQLPPGGPDHCLALFLEAEACLLRDGDAGPVRDFDNAIECLRRLRAALPAGDPDLPQVEARLAEAVFTRASRPGTRLADVDEAGALLTSMLGRLAPEDPGRREVLGNLALQRALRFAAFGGAEDDRVAAVAYARESLAARADDGQADDSADLCHFVIAWMALARQLTDAQRSMIFRRAEVENSMRDGAVAASLLAELGGFVVSAQDAETALGHLRQVSTAPANEGLRGMLPMLWGMALFVTVREGGSADVIADDVRRVLDELGHAVPTTAEAAKTAPGADVPDDTPALLSMRALLLTLHSEAPGGAGTRDQAVEALRDAALQLPPGHPMRSAELGLLRAGLERQVAEAATAEDAASHIGQIMAALDRMPRDDPEFGPTLAMVSARMLGVGLGRRAVLQDERITPQLERAAAALSPDDPLSVLAKCNHWTSVGLQAVLRQQPDAMDQVIAELKSLAASVPRDHPAKTFVTSGVAFALVDRHSMGREIRHLKEADDYVKQAFDSIDPAGPFAEGASGHAWLLYLRGHLKVVWSIYDPRSQEMPAAISDLERATAMIEDGHPMRSTVVSELELARATSELLTASPDGGAVLGATSRDAFGKILAAAQGQSPDHPEYPALSLHAAAGLALTGLADNDPKLIDRAISMFADACAVPGLAPIERPRVLSMHGFALLTRYVRRRDPRDLSNAIARLEEARRAVDQVAGSPDAANVLQTLSSAYRLRGNGARGDVDRAVTLGLAGLREHAGDVLLQDSDDHALLVARRGTGEATEMARWFLTRGREAAAVGALELGRGMVLHAATSGARVEEALREAGRADLAGEWSRQMSRGADSGGPPDLRYRVMQAIGQSPAEARLLSPPSVGDISAALTRSGADALVYLLPRDDGGLGLAVLVDRAKRVWGVPLPRLAADGTSPVRAFIRARRATEATEATEAAGAKAIRSWENTLDELCGWAWPAAIGPLLAAIPQPSRDRRVVLVPGGELGLVPWHAARQPGGGYACQQAVFSYASSARQFIDATRRRPWPWGQAPVLISDSERSLWLTAAGIRSMFAGHYPAARVFGYAREKLAPTVPGSAAATVDDVLAALPGGAGPGASMLHFGCHGRAEVPVLRSFLNLGVGGKVQVKEILEQARASQSREQDGGLVVLASCLSDVTDADYDEALTLAAAFLSAGAAGVVAARWSVDESATALFMAAFHRYLNASRLGPAQALREAQLWMLDPHRDLAGLPQELREVAELSGEPDDPDFTSPAAWAGFGYQGR